jgi:hypothetical protein
VSVPLSEDDLANSRYAIGVELAARDLYRAAITSGASGTAWPILANQHGSYAQRLAGLTGSPADRRDDAVYNDRVAAFQGDRPANAAYDLENTLVATNTTLLGQIVNPNVADGLASIVSIESRQAAYLAERSGRGDNFDALFTNTGQPLVRAVVP